MVKTIRVFEYEKLKIGDKGFTTSHYYSLLAFSEQHGFKYFNIGRESITFKSFVGIIQVGNVILEILPKVDKMGKEECYKILLTMLSRSGMLNIHNSEKAAQNLKRHTLIELFFLQFIKEAELLVYQGLKKKYQKENKNRTSLSGKLLFSENIKKNIVHRERFYTSAESYDRDNLYNRTIKKALIIIYEVSSNRSILSSVNKLLLHIEDIKDVNINEIQIKRIKYNRNTERYRNSIELAKLIIFQMMPDLTGGKNSVIALLFNMNVLFEKFVTSELQKSLTDYQVLAQKPQKYLLKKGSVDSFMMKPDITLQKNGNTVAILDTKWKLLNPEDKKRGISQSDIYQLYTYAGEYNCSNIALIYPKWSSEQLDVEKYNFQRSMDKSLFILSVSLNNIENKVQFRENLFTLINQNLIAKIN